MLCSDRVLPGAWGRRAGEAEQSPHVLSPRGPRKYGVFLGRNGSPVQIWLAAPKRLPRFLLCPGFQTGCRRFNFRGHESAATFQSQGAPAPPREVRPGAAWWLAAPKRSEQNACRVFCYVQVFRRDAGGPISTDANLPPPSKPPGRPSARPAIRTQGQPIN